MRLVSTLLVLALTGSMAAADEAKAPDPQPVVTKTKVPLRVVRVLAETHQALLFDKNRGTHVLADIGKSIDGYLVQDIDDDEVTLVAENGAEIVLAAPDPSWRRHRDDGTPPVAKPATAAAKPTAPAPVDPYAAPGPVDPYADADVRAVDAPHVIEAGEGGVRTAEAPDAAPATVTPAPTAPAPTTAPVAATTAAAPTTAPVAATTAAAPTTAPVVATTAATPTMASVAAPPATISAPVVTTALDSTVDAPLVLPRADVTAALSNFARLASSVRGSFTPAGVKLESIVAGSLFARAGLRTGDVIATVDNQPLHSLDDAANLYARAGAARSLTIQLARAGKPITLHIVIQ